MKRKLLQLPATDSGAGHQTNPDEFIDGYEVARRIQVCKGTLDNWRKLGKIPWVVTPGRSIRYFWPSVRDAFLRMQRGGEA
jgi:hypothetical protein